MTASGDGWDGLTYEGVGENKKWERMDTYGPKLVENIVQGTSRDILAEAMMRLKKAGFSIMISLLSIYFLTMSIYHL